MSETHGDDVVVDDQLRIEPELVELGEQRRQGIGAAVALGIMAPLVGTGLAGITGVGAHLVGESQQHPRQLREQRRFEAQRRRIAGQGVTVLRATNAARTRRSRL